MLVAAAAEHQLVPFVVQQEADQLVQELVHYLQEARGVQVRHQKLQVEWSAQLSFVVLVRDRDS